MHIIPFLKNMYCNYRNLEHVCLTLLLLVKHVVLKKKDRFRTGLTSPGF